MNRQKQLEIKVEILSKMLEEQNGKLAKVMAQNINLQKMIVET